VRGPAGRVAACKLPPQRARPACCPCSGSAWPRSAVLFPLVVTVYVTWWFLTFFDNFFSVRPRHTGRPDQTLVFVCMLRKLVATMDCSTVVMTQEREYFLISTACGAASVRGAVWVPCVWPGLRHVDGIHHRDRRAVRTILRANGMRQQLSA